VMMEVPSSASRSIRRSISSVGTGLEKSSNSLQYVQERLQRRVGIIWASTGCRVESSPFAIIFHSRSRLCAKSSRLRNFLFVVIRDWKRWENAQTCPRKDATISKGVRARNPKSANGRRAAAFGSPTAASGLLRTSNRTLKMRDDSNQTTSAHQRERRSQRRLLPQRFLDNFKKSL